MAKVIIIGNGPAGISTALYTSRAGIDTIVIGKDNGSLGKASTIENYYGLAEPVSGAELIANGIEGAKRLGAEVIQDEVLDMSYGESGTFIVTTKEKTYISDALVIATGTSRKTPKIKGLKELEGLGVSYCATCDAFFYRGKDVGVLGSSDYALHEAQELAATSGSVTIFTNGLEPTFENPGENIKVNTDKITAIAGDEFVEGLIFESGEQLSIDGLFVALGVAGSTDLARKIGAQVDNNKIVVDENMATNVPGLYAAGDCIGGLLQVSKAVSDGAKAGTELAKYLRNKKPDVKAANV